VSGSCLGASRSQMFTFGTAGILPGREHVARESLGGVPWGLPMFASLSRHPWDLR
jgi:hypothetical protein